MPVDIAPARAIALPDTRDALVDTLRAELGDLMVDDGHLSAFPGGRAAGLGRLAAIDPVAYGRTRNRLDGAVTRLSPYIRHGAISLAEVRDAALARGQPDRIEKFVQELAWRDYWQRVWMAQGDAIWRDREPYKTGYRAEDYADTLPADIAAGCTGVAVIDHFARELVETGWLHNHARMYLAAYVVHWRLVRWQAGAAWFLTHLVDGDPASNNLSWQWVASTFSRKPYIFNLENVRRYAGTVVDCRAEVNVPLDASYPDLTRRLFPALRAADQEAAQ